RRRPGRRLRPPLRRWLRCRKNQCSLRNSSINLCVFLTQRNALRQWASTAEALWADGLALATPVTVLLGRGRTVKGCVGRPRAPIGRDGEGVAGVVGGAGVGLEASG